MTRLLSEDEMKALAKHRGIGDPEDPRTQPVFLTHTEEAICVLLAECLDRPLDQLMHDLRDLKAETAKL